MNNSNQTVLEVAQLIYSKQQQIEYARKKLKPIGEKKDKANMKYERALAIQISELNNCVEYEIEGKKYKKPPASGANKIAAGMIAEIGFEKEQAETEYKYANKVIDSIKAEVNALQSIYKHLDQIVT